MKEMLFNVVHIDKEVGFKFYAAYHYNGTKKLIDINLYLKNFNLAIGTESKRVMFVPDFDYDIKAEPYCSTLMTKEDFDAFIETECLKIFKIEPTKLFKFLLSQNLYRFIAADTILLHQFKFKREDKKDFDYKDSIKYKNSSVCGIAYTTFTAFLPTTLFDGSYKERDLFNQDSVILERKTIEINIDDALKIPPEISFYCKENPYQLEFDFGEN